MSWVQKPSRPIQQLSGDKCLAMMTSQNDYSASSLKMRSTVLITLLFCSFIFWHGDRGQLGWFVFIRIGNTKPWNYFHICTVVLWTKIVVELMLLWSRLQR